jgi:hypothetical protein
MSINATNTDNLDIEENIPIDRQFKIVEDVLFRQVENEGILMHIPSGTYYSLNETSILFWEAIVQQQALEPIVDKIMDEYDVDRNQLLTDLQAFIKDLSDFGLISPSSNQTDS